jgi:hypothetical protein
MSRLASVVYDHRMGERLTRREQLVLVRILKTQPPRDEVERMLQQLTAKERAAVEGALAHTQFGQVPRRRRRTTLRTRGG